MNIKPLQIFIFSLVPLALVFAGVVGGSIHGSDSKKERFPTSAAAAPSSGPAPTAVPGTTVLTLTAQNLTYDKSSLTAPANAPVTIQLNNQDAGILHNVGVYRTTAASQPLATGSTGQAPFAGQATQAISFTTPGAGTYFFRCEVHPDTMRGSFIVR